MKSHQFLLLYEQKFYKLLETNKIRKCVIYLTLSERCDFSRVRDVDLVLSAPDNSLSFFGLTSPLFSIPSLLSLKV